MKTIKRIGTILGAGFVLVLLSPGIAWGLHDARKAERRRK